MAFDQALLDAVDAAIATMMAAGGAQTITYGDRTHTFQKLSDLLAFRATLAHAVTTTPGFRLAATDKGV